MSQPESSWVQLQHHTGYEISTDGQVRNLRTGKILNPMQNQAGVSYVAIRNTTEGRYENKTLGHLVAETFCPGQSEEYSTVLHKDGNMQNNHPENLMWSSLWHTRAYHAEIRALLGRRSRDIPVMEETTGLRFPSIKAAAMATGCLPSNIEYSCRYNDQLARRPGGSRHRTFPGNLVFLLSD